MAKTTFTRQELYDLVWSKPVSHIAKEYGFSDNGIRKICKKYNIPLPNSGYWSKLKFNKKVVKTKLPKQDDNPQISLEKTNPQLYAGDNPLSKLALRKKEILQAGLNITVPEQLSNPHHLIKSTKEYYKQVEIARKKGGWGHDVDSSKALSISVANNLYPRAFRFMDTLLKLIEKRGHKIECNKYNTKVIIKGQSYSIRLIEKSKRVKRETSYSYDTFDLEPTGNICLKIDHSYPIKEWSDGKIKKLEDRLVDILAWLEIKGEEDEQRSIENAIRQKKRDEEREIEEALQKQKDEELAKFEGLFKSAERFQKSQYLRNFIQEFEDYAIKSKTLNPEKQEWINWAKEKADWYDPFIEREVPLLNDIDRDTLKPKKRSYW
ncbi:hypothetical protein [Oceanihabitans sediminis]|uniref:hypothetical protein n=1 Tax=Oceanihabitans sediminis TaxID=1812012 RepID=UPI003A94ED7B